ncbi:MAG: type pilus assembly protein PilM [Pedosphaera sp.]|nr:type pilus assembly protein PilM [Pedosphaera sp.]
MRMLLGEHGLELALERRENGRLTALCLERVTLGLQGFLRARNWQSRQRAFCAIGARGVSLRSLKLPAASKDELQGLLRLQIESEFPLPPEELAWGWIQAESKEVIRAGAPGGQELVVAAIRKEVIEEYSRMFSASGVDAVFMVAALARTGVCPPVSGTYAVLDIGRHQSELGAFDKGVPTSIRVLPWGGENITRAIAEKLKISPGEAEKLKAGLDLEAGASGELGHAIQDAMETALGALAALIIKSHWTGRKLYLAGRSMRHKDLAARLDGSLGRGGVCERLELAPGEGRSAATLGMKRMIEAGSGRLPLIIHTEEMKGTVSVDRHKPWKWAAAALAIGMVYFALPYAEALIMKPRLERKLAEFNNNRGGLLTIDQEFEFFQFLKKNQPPYLDAIHLFAKAAPAGTRIDALSMNRRGDVSIKGNMQSSQQVVEFRSKLIESGFFSSVAVEEQTPTGNQQSVMVRISAQWKSGVESLAHESRGGDPGKTNIFKADVTAAGGHDSQSSAATPAKSSPPRTDTK